MKWMISHLIQLELEVSSKMVRMVRSMGVILLKLMVLVIVIVIVEYSEVWSVDPQSRWLLIRVR